MIVDDIVMEDVRRFFRIDKVMVCLQKCLLKIMALFSVKYEFDDLHIEFCKN